MGIASYRVLSNRYRIQDVIGEGAMAQVFRGTDLLLERPVAIKVLRPQYAADPEVVTRFEYEARAVAKLRHPNIVEVYDVGDDNGLRYIVEELIEGQSLRQIIDSQGPLPIQQAVDYARQMCLALQAAHRQGIVHRDVKPQNVLVTPEGTLKMVDFGIAKALAASSLTQQGIFWGSPAYTAPEQAKGEGTVPASDIYSLGVVLFEMLTGRLPFEADSPIAVVVAHMEKAPPRPSQFRASIPAWLDSLVLRALAKEPSQRFASADEFRAALSSGMEGSLAATSIMAPVKGGVTGSRPASPMARMPQDVAYPRRHRSNLASVLGLVLIILASAAIGYAAYLAAPSLLQGFLSVASIPTPQSQPTPTQVARIETPRLIGLSLEQAQQVALGAGLSLKVESERYDADAPTGTVLSQQPAPNTAVPPGTAIAVTVSKGPEPVTIPGAVNVPYPVAKGILEALGLKVERKDEASTTVPEGAVVRSEPPFGTAVPPGSSVTLVVSVGDKVKVPDVFNWPLADAERAIEQAGLKVGSVNFQTQEDIPHFDITKVGVGHALSVTPDFNTWVPRGTVIYIAVRAK